MRRCLDCRALTTGTRCPNCYRRQQRDRNADRPHYGPGYWAAARACVAAANADPAKLCARCGQPARPNDQWTAGHVNDGEVLGDLRAEHASCNYATGGRRAGQR